LSGNAGIEAGLADYFVALLIEIGDDLLASVNLGLELRSGRLGVDLDHRPPGSLGLGRPLLNLMGRNGPQILLAHYWSLVELRWARRGRRVVIPDILLTLNSRPGVLGLRRDHLDRGGLREGRTNHGSAARLSVAGVLQLSRLVLGGDGLGKGFENDFRVLFDVLGHFDIDGDGDRLVCLLKNGEIAADGFRQNDHCDLGLPVHSLRVFQGQVARIASLHAFIKREL
jgi:hypothetical protein